MIRYTFGTEAGNELERFTSELTSKHTSSLEKSLKSIKVDEGKCEDEIGVFSFFGASSFTIKALGATFATDTVVFKVRIVP